MLPSKAMIFGKKYLYVSMVLVWKNRGLRGEVYGAEE